MALLVSEMLKLKFLSFFFLVVWCTEALMLDQPGHQQLIERSIDFRCEDMLLGAEGVLSEARWLLDLGLLPNTSSDTRAIGYRQAMEYLSNVIDKWV
ncbi:hypothetical protein Bca52824_095733 [Brassica carinata]|uniref:Uncharacterized protein n=1 Tax=Brassica carinata TaxID=52824 RepID=A0A8X7NZV6_BRACI|nr:hypothetical protein Bca52824_095733 [Brassica carinata]